MSSRIHHILILTLLIIERLAWKKPFMYTTVLELIHPVLQKSALLSFATQLDVKPFVFRQSNNEKIVRSTSSLFLLIKCYKADQPLQLAISHDVKQFGNTSYKNKNFPWITPLCHPPSNCLALLKNILLY